MLCTWTFTQLNRSRTSSQHLPGRMKSTSSIVMQRPFCSSHHFTIQDTSLNRNSVALTHTGKNWQCFRISCSNFFTQAASKYALVLCTM